MGDSFAALFEGQAAPARRKRVRVGDRLEAVVIQIGRELVFLELDDKQQAFIEAVELRAPDGTIDVAIGDKLHAHVVEVDEARGSVRLGRSLGRPGSLAAVEQAKASGVAVEGKVTGVNKGGLELDLGGTRAFCPMSQIGDRFIEDVSGLVGQSLQVLVTDVRDGGKSVVVSRRALLQREAGEALEKTMSDIVVGAVLRGTVARSTDFGRFVRIAPGVEGLLHVSELGRGVEAAEGEELLVLVKKIDREAKKIGLALAPEGAEVGAIVANPSAGIPVGAVVNGVVERIETYGIFVQVDGTRGRAGRGLVPNAELGVPRGTDTRKTFPEGTRVTAKVLETGEGRLRLSIKGAKEVEERADFEAAKGRAGASRSLGTFADLLKGRKL